MSAEDRDDRMPLACLLPGTCAEIDRLGELIDPTQQEQIIAYGLAPGRIVTVLQQRPMTLVMVDEVELAIEGSVAREIWVRRQ